MSRDFELDSNVSCEESTISRQYCTGLIFVLLMQVSKRADRFSCDACLNAGHC